MDFSRLIERFQQTYYSELLTFIVELVALILGVIYVRKDKIGQLFIKSKDLELAVTNALENLRCE